MKSQAISIIQESFSIEEEATMKFQTLDEAEEYFVRKLSYARTAENIFMFEYPTSCETHQREVFCHEDMFILRFNDILSLLHNNPISPKVIDFVMQCFNMYTHNNMGNEIVPSIICGSSNDIKSIVPSESFYAPIWDYYNSSMAAKTSITATFNLSYFLKHWFVKDDKGFLTNVLDKYNNNGFLVDKYATIHQLEDGTYVYFYVKFHEKIIAAFASTVTTMDVTNTHKSVMEISSAWFSKFFGLYNKDTMNTLEFIDDDFNGIDVKLLLDFPDNFDNSSMQSSLLSTQIALVSQVSPELN